MRCLQRSFFVEKCSSRFVACRFKLHSPAVADRGCPIRINNCMPCIAGEQQKASPEVLHDRADKGRRRLLEFAVNVTAGPPNSIFRHTKVQHWHTWPLFCQS